jgi:hypothetical protein
VQQKSPTGLTGELVLMDIPKDIIRRMLIVMCNDSHPFFLQERAKYKDAFQFMYGLDIEAEIINLLEDRLAEQEEHF